MTLPRMPSMRLDHRRALVTGAGRGIGLAAAAALAQAGAHVVLAARTLSEIEAAAVDIRADGGSATPLILDVTDMTAVRAAIETAEPFEILINNAGTNRPRPFLDVTEDENRAAELSRKARERASNFSWEKCARETIAAYKVALRELGSAR